MIYNLILTWVYYIQNIFYLAINMTNASRPGANKNLINSWSSLIEFKLSIIFIPFP